MCSTKTPSVRPPIVDAISRSMPSRKLINCRPAVPADTALEVAMTVIRLTAAAILNSNPNPALRNGTRNTPPPRPRSDPMQPPTAPAAITASARETLIRWARNPVGRVLSSGAKRGVQTPRLSHAPAILRRRARAELVSDRVRPQQARRRDRSAAGRRRLPRCGASARPHDHACDRDPHPRRLRVGRAGARGRGRARRRGPWLRPGVRARRAGGWRTRARWGSHVDDAAYAGSYAGAHCGAGRDADRAPAAVHRRPVVGRRGRPAGSPGRVPAAPPRRTAVLISAARDEAR